MRGQAGAMEQVSSGKIGRYEIIKVLGRGGMGEVLLAQDENLGRKVAIKRPFKSAVAEGLARFQVEAKAATLRHPNIPAVYEMGVHDDLPFIAMEFVEGESLEKVIDSKRELDLITKLRIIEQVCSALGYAHENGIIHRDIKPANIIVQPDGVAKIIDFGIAKVQDDEGSSGLTKASQLIGSLHYIAPERFWGGTIDGRVDIFSVGVTLFKLLTGTEPFLGGEATASFKIMNEAHAPLSAYLHDYPPVLDEIVAKSLAKNPEERYLTGEDFAEALHEVVEDLKRTRVTELFGDAERLTTEKRFAPALELLDEAIKLDPAHTQARKLRKFVREHQERARRAERLRDALLRADEALMSGNYDEALTQLKDAQNLDPESADIKAKIQSVDEKKRRYDRSVKALGEAELTKSRGDINGAMRIVTRALQEDPDNKKLLAASAVLGKELEIELQREKLLGLLDQATRAVAARNYDAAEQILNEASAIDPSNLECDKLRREIARARELEQRRAALDELQLRVHEFIRSDAFEQASDLINRALDRLPNETILHRLKTEVDAEARKFEVRRFVDDAISQARELFAGSPFEALQILQKALDRMPGEERLVAYERSLRQELDSRRSEQLRESTLLKARELLDSRQFDKAIGVLESFELEIGQQPDIESLLAFARSERAAQERLEIVSRSLGDARALIREGRLEEASSLLEAGAQRTGDSTMAALLRDVREQQSALARKVELLQKRVLALRERGELDEASQLLREQLAATPGDATLQQMAAAIAGEREQKQITKDAIQKAAEAVQRKDFNAGLESLRAASRAYGESPEIARAIQDVENKRAAHARETVGKSIESARAALLKSDPKAALESLKSATPFLEFADEQKQADWQRIGQSVKKALQEAGATGSHAVAGFDKQLSEIASAKPRRVPVLAIAGAAVVVIAIAVVAVIMFRPAPKPVNMARIEITNATPGAIVTVEGLPPQPVPANGAVSISVKPGHYGVTVTSPDCEPFADALDLGSGDTTKERVDCQKKIAPNLEGYLVVSAPSDLPNVRVFVDGSAKGVKHSGDQIPLSIATHTVRYAWTGYQDGKDHPITIAKAADSVIDRVVLEKMAVTQSPAPNTNASKSPAPVTPTQAPQPPPVVSQQTQQPPSGGLNITPGTSVEKGQQITLIWNVSNANSVQLSGFGSVEKNGYRTVPADKTTTYTLMADNVKLDEKTVQVHEAPVKAPESAPIQQQVPPPVTHPAAPAAVALPDANTLMAALAPYKAVFAGATGKNCKSAFTSSFGGKLKGFADWCGTAKSFSAVENSCKVGGAPDSPTFSCAEEIVTVIDGKPQPIPSSKTFHFKKSPEGAYQLIGW